MNTLNMPTLDNSNKLWRVPTEEEMKSRRDECPSNLKNYRKTSKTEVFMAEMLDIKSIGDLHDKTSSPSEIGELCVRYDMKKLSVSQSEWKFPKAWYKCDFLKKEQLPKWHQQAREHIQKKVKLTNTNNRKGCKDAHNAEAYFRIQTNRDARKLRPQSKVDYVLMKATEEPNKEQKLVFMTRGDKQELFSNFNGDDEQGEKRVDGTCAELKDGQPNSLRAGFKLHVPKGSAASHQQVASIQEMKTEHGKKLNAFPETVDVKKRIFEKMEREGKKQLVDGDCYDGGEIKDDSLKRHAWNGTNTEPLDVLVSHYKETKVTLGDDGVIVIEVHNFWIDKQIPPTPLHFVFRYTSEESRHLTDEAGRKLANVRPWIVPNTYLHNRDHERV